MSLGIGLISVEGTDGLVCLVFIFMVFARFINSNYFGLFHWRDHGTFDSNTPVFPGYCGDANELLSSKDTHIFKRETGVLITSKLPFPLIQLPKKFRGGMQLTMRYLAGHLCFH